MHQGSANRAATLPNTGSCQILHRSRFPRLRALGSRTSLLHHRRHSTARSNSRSSPLSKVVRRIPPGSPRLRHRHRSSPVSFPQASRPRSFRQAQPLRQDELTMPLTCPTRTPPSSSAGCAATWPRDKSASHAAATARVAAGAAAAATAGCETACPALGATPKSQLLFLQSPPAGRRCRWADQERPSRAGSSFMTTRRSVGLALGA
mmetsp:Transcript_17049/g.54200  ORF Transcript_17049/g.54200 Transcript_17049/m.54200 type:complete len:206 (-) Transcript_17049:444-1061(-)